MPARNSLPTVWRVFPGHMCPVPAQHATHGAPPGDDAMKRAALALHAQPVASAAMGLEVETSVLAVSTSQCAASTAQQHGASVCTTAGSAAVSRPALRLANSEGWVGVTSRAHCMAREAHGRFGLHAKEGHSSMRPVCMAARVATARCSKGGAWCCTGREGTSCGR